MANNVPDRANSPKRKLSAKSQALDNQLHPQFDDPDDGYPLAIMTEIMGSKRQSASARRYLNKKNK